MTSTDLLVVVPSIPGGTLARDGLTGARPHHPRQRPTLTLPVHRP